MTVDNWQHRSSKMTCFTCMYFVTKLPLTMPEAQKDSKIEPTQLGRCRRHAPTLGGWPAVYSSDWCGDHKLDENRA